MGALTPMFDNRSKLIIVDDENGIRKTKTRKDKKFQIKVPVTKEEKLYIARTSFQSGYNGEIHSYLAEVFCQAVERPYIQYTQPVCYLDYGTYVSTKVTKDVYQKVIELKVEWGVRSIRQAAHRILINELKGMR